MPNSFSEASLPIPTITRYSTEAPTLVSARSVELMYVALGAPSDSSRDAAYSSLPGTAVAGITLSSEQSYVHLPSGNTDTMSATMYGSAVFRPAAYAQVATPAQPQIQYSSLRM
jgi:hypothetical protein